MTPLNFNAQKLINASFETGPIRPPSEGGSSSLLLRTTRNCPWSRCKFCYAIMYNRRKFQIRSVEDVCADIDAVNIIADVIKSVSRQMGFSGEVNREVGAAIITTAPALNASTCFEMVFAWLYAGAKTVFLQDANSLTAPTGQLVTILMYLTKTFPSIERITSYARASTIARKTSDELKKLRKAGLSRLHVGLETGDDALLKYIDKGVTSNQQIQAGKQAKEAGFELSEYVMIDLGGRKASEQHAKNTARVLNEIDPNYIRLRPFAIGPMLPLYEDYEKGDFVLSSPHERLEELKIMVERLDITGRLCFDHFLNCWYKDPTRRSTLFKQDYEGYKFPEQKSEVLALIEKGLNTDESVHLHIKDIIGMRNL